VEKYRKAGNTIARWIPKATNTSSEYVIVIAIPQQQWLSERASTLRYMYIAPVVSLDLALVPRTLAHHSRRVRNHTKIPKSAPVTGQLATLNK